MRRFLSALVTALIVPLAAHAQAPKPVEVINDPLEVEVVNPAPECIPLRWQLVGFTSATYPGAMGGNFGVTRKCQLEFPNSRMCSIEEAVATTSIPSELSGRAWTHAQGAAGAVIFAGTPVAQSTNCLGWRSGIPTLTGNVISDEGIADVISDCNRAHPIACCALVP
jgi:hypothetical protein